MCDFSLSDAVSEIVGSFADFAAANGHMLTAEIAPEILYHGDEYAIRQLVSILLDNVVKYASDGSPIRLTLEKGKKGPVLRTVNCCEGLTQQQADKLFDRFYRVDQSRTTGGFGIGLSMARSIAEGHKGSINKRWYFPVHPSQRSGCRRRHRYNGQCSPADPYSLSEDFLHHKCRYTLLPGPLRRSGGSS